ncbi:hypothetical protein RUND412_007772 [Rhizina undulata]
MFSSSVTNSQVNYNNNNVVNSGNTNVNIQTASGNVIVNTGLQGQDNKRFEILKWLSQVDSKQHHDYIASVRQVNTGHWLFRKHHFLQWNKASSSIFWLYGIEPPSILSTIVKHLSLLSPEGYLPKAMISLYNEQRKDGVESRRLGLDKSTELIRQLSKAFEQTVIIVDALDECNKETRYQLLVALKKLRPSTEGLKIFLTSRNDDDIRIELENEAEFYIQSSDNSSDIELFVVAEVEKYILTKRLLSGEVRPELKQTIIDTLNKGANGM